MTHPMQERSHVQIIMNCRTHTLLRTNARHRSHHLPRDSWTTNRLNPLLPTRLITDMHIQVAGCKGPQQRRQQPAAPQRQPQHQHRRQRQHQNGAAPVCPRPTSGSGDSGADARRSSSWRCSSQPAKTSGTPAKGLEQTGRVREAILHWRYGLFPAL